MQKNRVCDVCGYDKGIEVHHIKPRSLGGTDDEENLIPLCRRCHKLVHSLGVSESEELISIRSKGIKQYLFLQWIKESQSKYGHKITVDMLQERIEQFKGLSYFIDFIISKLRFDDKGLGELISLGMDKARANGVKMGRPQTTVEDIPVEFKESYTLYKSGKVKIMDIARKHDISRTTVYKYVEMLNKQNLLN